MFLTFPTPPDTAWAFRQPYHEIPCVAVSLGHPCLNTRVVLGALNFGDFERLKLVGDVDSCIAWIGRPEDREAQQARAWRRLTKKFRGEDLLEWAAKTGWRVDAWFSRSPEPGANAAVFGEEAGVALPPPLDEILGEPRDVFFRVVAERREAFEKAKKAKEAKKIKAKTSDRPSRTARRAAKKKKVSEETKDGDESEALFVVNEEVTAATQENVPLAGRNGDLNDVVMCPVAEAEQQVGGIDPAASSPYVFFERELDALIKESSDQAFPDVKFEDFPLPQDIPLLVDTTCEPRPSPAVTGNPFTDWKKPDVFLPGENKAFDDGFARLLGNFNDLGRNISAQETAAPGQQAPSRNPFLSSRQHAPHPNPFISSGQQRPLPNPFDSPSPFDSPVEQTPNRNPFFSSGQQAPHPNPFDSPGQHTPHPNPFDFSGQHVPHPNPFVSSGQHVPHHNPFVSSGQQTPHPNPFVSSGPRAPYPNPFVSSSPRGPPPATTSKKPIMGHFATKLQAPLGLVGQGSPPETEKPLVYKKVRPATPASEPIHGARSLTSTSSTIIQNTPGSDEDTDVIRETPRKSTKRSKAKGKGPKTPAASGNKKAATSANPFSDEHEIYDATPPKEAAPSQQPNNAEEKDAKQLTKEQRKEKAARRKQRRQAQKAEEEEKKRLLDEIKAAEIQKREAREKQERDEKTREIIERMHQKFEDDRKRQAEEEAEEARRLQEAIEEEERRKAAEEQRAIAEADAKKRQAELQQAVAEQKRLRAQAAAEKQRATDEDEAKKKQADLAAAEEKRLLEQAAAEKQRLDEQVAAEKQRLADQAAAEKKQEEERRQAAAAEEERLAQQAQQQAAAEEQLAREAAARKAKRSLEKAAEEEKRLAAVKAVNEKKKLLRKKKQRLAADRVAAEERRRHEEAERALGDLPRKGVGHPKKIEPALEEKIWNLDDSEPECADLGQEACAVDLDRGEATAHGDAIDCGDAAAHAAARTPAHAAAIDAGDATDAGDSANHGDAIGIDVAMDANNAIDLGDVVGVDEACLEVTAPSNGPGVVSAVDMTAYYAEENAFVVDQILRYGFWNPEWRYNKSHRGRGRSKSVPGMAPQGPGRQDGSVASEV